MECWNQVVKEDEESGKYGLVEQIREWCRAKQRREIQVERDKVEANIRDQKKKCESFNARQEEFRKFHQRESRKSRKCEKKKTKRTRKREWLKSSKFKTAFSALRVHYNEHRVQGSYSQLVIFLQKLDFTKKNKKKKKLFQFLDGHG